MRKIPAIIIATLFIQFSGLHVYAQKTDKILLDNNDWITGEIKKMDYAKLSLSTSAAGTIQIKWDRILQIRSDKFFEINLGKGRKYYGSIAITEDDKKYVILAKSKDEEIELNMNLIIGITPIKKRFWTRIDGNIDLGFSYTKASEVRQFNSSFRIDYRATKSLISTSGNSIFTEQPGRETTTKQDFALSYKHFAVKNYAWSTFGALQQNSELGIDLRSLFGMGLSKNWLRSNIQRLITTVGAIINEEKGSSKSTTNFEGLVRLEYRIFKYRDPEVDLTSYLEFYPSFTVADRYRTDLDIKFKIEIVKNFYIGLTFYHNLDTKPPENAASRSDWGITSSLGYSF